MGEARTMASGLSCIPVQEQEIQVAVYRTRPVRLAQWRKVEMVGKVPTVVKERKEQRIRTILLRLLCSLRPRQKRMRKHDQRSSCARREIQGQENCAAIAFAVYLMDDREE